MWKNKSENEKSTNAILFIEISIFPRVEPKRMVDLKKEERTTERGQ